MQQNGSLTTKQIAKKANISESYARKLLIKLRKEGLIESIDLGVTKEHRITKKGRLLIEKDDSVLKARVHNIRVSCNVLQADYEKIIEHGKRIKMNNWDAYLVNLKSIVNLNNIPDICIRFNIANKTTAVIYLKEFYASSKWEAATIIHNNYQKVRRALQIADIILDEDWNKVKAIYGEYAFELDHPLDPGHVIDLGRNAKDPFDKELSVNAKVWVDESRGLEIETNDADYTHNYLLMPERIARIEKKIVEDSELFIAAKEVVNQMTKANEAIAESARILAEHTKSHVGYAQKMVEAGEYFVKGSRYIILILILMLAFSVIKGVIV